MPRNTRSSWGSNKPARRKGYRTLRYWADEHDGRGYMRHTITIQGSKRDGDRKLAELRLLHSEDKAVPTIGQAWESWILPEYNAMHQSYLENPRPSKRGSRESVKTSTYNQVMSTWKVHVCPRWGDAYADAVKYSDVQEWLDGLTEQIGKRALSQLSLILDKCLINDCIDKNVASYKYRMPTKAKKHDDGGIWSLDEIHSAILPAVKGHPCEAAVILSAIAGCRTGEAIAPLLSEVHPIEASGMTFACAEVPRQVDNDGRISSVNDLKNIWSPRSVVVPPPWSMRLLEIRDDLEIRGLQWLSDKGTCEPMGQKAVRQDFSKCIKKAGVEPRQFRALRRSWRTWISSKGINEKILEKMMGHSDGTTTGRYYLKADANIIVEEMARACDWGELATRLGDIRDK